MFLVSGSAGFIGFHVAQYLLDRGERVIGIDNLNPYYDVALKHARLARLEGRASWGAVVTNWSWVFLANLLGSVAFGILIAISLTNMGKVEAAGVAARSQAQGRPHRRPGGADDGAPGREGAGQTIHAAHHRPRRAAAPAVRQDQPLHLQL